MSDRLAGRTTKEEPPPANDSVDAFDVDDTSSLRPGEDGTIGVLLARPGSGSAYLTLDDDGHVLQVGSPPDNAVTPTLAGYGRRVLAVAASAETGQLLVWESLDGGANWEAQAAPVPLGREFAQGSSAIACGLAGCLIGETVSRVGWGGRNDPVQASTPTSRPDQRPRC